MKFIIPGLLALGMAAPCALGEYTFFEDNFESAPPAGPNVDPTPLLGNGMLVGANIFTSGNVYLPIGYFGIEAPNITGDGSRFCNITPEEGGDDQGTQVLAVYNDYNNTAAHTKGGETSEGSGIYTGGDLVDANVYVEFFVEEADLGITVTFEFDAKIGNFLAGPVAGTDPSFDTEAEAFLKVLDPDNDYQPFPNIQVIDASLFPDTWATHSLTLTIDPAWEGKLLQAGFRNKTSNYTPTGVFYDNVSLTSDRVEVVEPGPTILSTSWDGGVFTVTFDGKDGFEYTLFKAASINGPYDDPVDFIDGQGAEEFLSDDTASGPRGFYKLDEQQIPGVRIDTQRFMTRREMPRRRPGFTLVELMVVIVIVAALSSLAFMMAGRAKKAAKNAATLNNLREIGTGVAAWMSENGNFYPPCWDNTQGKNRSWAQTLDPYIHNEENFRDVNSKFIGPNKRIPVEVNQYSHPITYTMNRAVCRDKTTSARGPEVKLIHATQVGRLPDVILMADGCQNPANLGQANASAYQVFAATGATGSRGEYSKEIPVGPDEDTGTGDGWFRYPGGKCQALMCDGSARSFPKGSIKYRNIWIDRERN